jgi:peptidoglycan/LPS O-acetylase OafA/YrhL
MVMIAHTFGIGLERLNLASQWVHSLGHYGVSIFFCLSGFLLYRPFVSATLDGTKMPAFGPYIRNRLLRIVPLFWFALAVYVFVFPNSPSSRPTRPIEWIGTVLFGQVYFNNGAYWLIFAAWTLGVELAFYFGLPFIAKGLRWMANRAGPDLEHRVVGLLAGLGVVALVGLAYKLIVAQFVHLTAAVNGFPPAWLDWFAAGMALAVAQVANSRGLRLPTWLTNLGRWPLLAVVASVGFYWISVQSFFYFLQNPTILHALTRHYAMLGAGICALIPAVIGTDQPSPIRSFLAWRPMAALGTISYGIYLWHPGFVKIFFKVYTDGGTATLLGRKFTVPGLVPDASGPAARFGGGIDKWALFAWVLGATLVTATVSYWGIERLFMSLKSTAGGRRSRPQNQPDPLGI